VFQGGKDKEAAMEQGLKGLKYEWMPFPLEREQGTFLFNGGKQSYRKNPIPPPV